MTVNIAEIETGKTYLVNHSRRGQFFIRVDRKCDDVVVGIITKGKTRALLGCNEKSVGDKIGMSTNLLLSAVEQPIEA